MVSMLSMKQVISIIIKKKDNKGICKESTISGHRKSHLGLRFFLCPLMVDSLHLPLFPL